MASPRHRARWGARLNPRPARRILATLLSLAALAGGCGTSDDDVVVLAASSLTEAFRGLEPLVEDATGVDVAFSFGGSGVLVAQEGEGAPIDVIATADPALLEGRGEVFARSRMVAVTSRASDADVRNVADLGAEGVRVVLARESVPAGRFAREGLREAGILAAVLENVVSEEPNVKAVAAKVALGEADAGIVYTTDLRADDRLVPAGEPFDVVAEYGVTVARDPQNAEGARAVVDYLFSAAAQKALAEFGFEPVRR